MKLLLASVIWSLAKPNFPFSARSSPKVTKMSSFLLMMSSSFVRQYDRGDSRAAKVSSPCWRALLRTAKGVRTSLRMQRVPINWWDMVCISRLQVVTPSSLKNWISEGASGSSQSDWKALLSPSVASCWITLLAIGCSRVWSSDSRNHSHLLISSGMYPIALPILHRSHQTSPSMPE